MTPLAVAEIIPVFARRIWQIGPLPGFLSRQIEDRSDRTWYQDSEDPGGERQLIEPKMDCVIFGLASFRIEALPAHLHRALQVLDANGQITFVGRGRPEPLAPWDDQLAKAGLIRYHEGPVGDAAATEAYWAFTAVRGRYNPVAHARQLADSGRPDWAEAVIDAIPGTLVPHENLRTRLNREKSRYQNIPRQTVFLGLVKGENYGWGVCSKYLIKELSRMRPVEVLDPSDGAKQTDRLAGPLFQALTNVNFDPMFPKARGTKNLGYAFFENELTDISRTNARDYDKVLAGSTWCLERMQEKGIPNGDVLIQGIDPQIFYPIETPSDPERFVIFSGGKFELRKGQDLVLRAVKVMQDKYPDVWLVNCWYNLWPASTRLMGYSPHIRFEHRDGEPWTATMHRTYEMNGLDHRRIITCELMPQESQRELFARTNVGLFPNRCEGGTNLVLMEYMACAKPVIAANSSGHRDIVNEHNAILLNQLAPFNLVDARGELVARWQDPSIDEIVSRLEYAYHHRQELLNIGRQAGTDLKNFTWTHTARRLLQVIEGEA